MVWQQPLAAVAHQLDLETALTSTDRNDLLPPRHEDIVGGEVGRRLLEALSREVLAGRYEPEPAVVVSVPKPSLTTRPAALLTITDRAVYDALVAQLRSRIDKFLVPEETVFWPRGAKASPKRWREFDEAPINATSAATHVCLLDIAGFYETVSHDRLAEVLITGTGRRALVEALVEFLSRVMDGDRGLPQGLTASDPLATAFLTPLDRAMLREGSIYFRNGDDIRIAVTSYSQGREAVAHAEAELRQLGMTLNPSKCRILTRETYQKQLRHVDEAKTTLRRRLEDLRMRQILDGDKVVLLDVARQIGVDEQWADVLSRDDLLQMVAGIAEDMDGGYSRLVSFDEQIDALRPLTTPGEAQLACDLLDESIAVAPHTGQRILSPEEFHERIQDALLTLGAEKDPCAVKYAASLAQAYPAEMELIASYLRAVSAKDRAAVAAQMEAFVAAPEFKYPWQLAWAFRLLLDCRDVVPQAVINEAMKVAGDASADPFAVVAGLELLADVGRLDHETLTFRWRSLPRALRPDMVAAAVRASRHENDWTAAFLEGCGGDRVNEVVMHHLGYDSAGPSPPTYTAGT